MTFRAVAQLGSFKGVVAHGGDQRLTRAQALNSLLSEEVLIFWRGAPGQAFEFVGGGVPLNGSLCPRVPLSIWKFALCG